MAAPIATNDGNIIDSAIETILIILFRKTNYILLK